MSLAHRQRLQTQLKCSEFGLGVRWVLRGIGCYSALIRPDKIETRLQLQISGSACVVTPSWLGEVVEFYLLIF